MTARHSFAFLVAVTAVVMIPMSQGVGTQSSSPSVSSVSGSLNHGSTVAISGSGFGTKPTGAPWKWDAMNGSTGERLEPRGWLVHQNNPQPILSSQRVRPGTDSTAAVKLTMTGTAVPAFGFGNNDGGYLDFTSASASNYRPFPIPAWIDYWMYFRPPTGSNNYKFFRHHANNASSIPNGLWAMPGSGGVTSCPSFVWSAVNTASVNTNPPNADLGCPEIANRWVHVQMMFHATNNNTGKFVMWVDGIRRFNVLDFGFEVGSSQRANFLVESQQLTTTGDGEMYIDDFFIENTYAHVEIGDAPTYAASRHREVQIPVSWSNNAVSVTLNRGSFPSFSGLYLYVFNAQGVPSPGYSLGGTQQATPTAPRNLRIVP